MKHGLAGAALVTVVVANVVHQMRLGVGDLDGVGLASVLLYFIFLIGQRRERVWEGAVSIRKGSKAYAGVSTSCVLLVRLTRVEEKT